MTKPRTGDVDALHVADGPLNGHDVSGGVDRADTTAARCIEQVDDGEASQAHGMLHRALAASLLTAAGGRGKVPGRG